MAAALRSESLARSSCTSYGVRDSSLAPLRTSSSLVLKPHLAANYGAEQLTRKLYRDTRSVLGAGDGATLTGEYPQVAHYQAGEHFLEHEDAFPFEHAVDTNYQRRATLLLYLNTVERGGSTVFPGLDLEVKPEQGKALLFFPSFADGKPDHRTLHEARPAVDDKWIAQVWIGTSL